MSIALPSFRVSTGQLLQHVSRTEYCSRDYSCTQQVSARVHAISGNAGLPRFDGVLFPSRNNYPGVSIALFERANTKVKVFKDINLIEHTQWPQFVTTYRVIVMPDPGPVEPDDAAS